MAYGGGSWVTQNKVMPGTYINFTSLAKAASALSDRGIAAAPFALSWGPEDTVFTVTAEDFQKKSPLIFGYEYDAPEMLVLREIFRHATTVICYRLGSGATKATCDYGTARCPGARGNDLRIVIAESIDVKGSFEVSTYLGSTCYETQTVASATELVSNDYVDFTTTATLKAEAGVNLTGGADCTEITGAHHQAFLEKIEAYAFNTLCCPVLDGATVAIYVAYTKRLRNELGAKFQLVAWRSAADCEGVIGVWNAAGHTDIADADARALLYWVAGAQAGVAVNKTLTNTVYDGELVVDVAYTQFELEEAIKSGRFMFHNANGTVRVLADINTLVTLTEEKGELFQSNQTVRVCDQIANDVAVLFNTRYVGTVPNDASGRSTLWNDVVKIIQQLESIRAVENFDTDTVTVELGEDKKAVLLTINGLNIISAMAQLYMSVIIR